MAQAELVCGARASWIRNHEWVNEMKRWKEKENYVKLLEMSNSTTI